MWIRRLAPLAAVLGAAAAAWLAQGTIGFTSQTGSRIAALPLSLAAFAAAAAAGGVVGGLWLAGASLAPVALLAVLLLPWLPGDVPAAFLVWTGPPAWLVGLAVVLLMMASLPKRPRVPSGPGVAFAAALVVFAVAAWRTAPMTPGGDEPHYLVITQSLLLDRDLSIEGVHRRGDYRAYYGGDLPPHVQRRGRDGRLYSVHAPGVPVLVAPAFLAAGHAGAMATLILVAAAGSVLAWRLGYRATGRSDAAWFGWAAVTLPVTAIFQSFTIYPDGPGGVLALTGLRALVRADDEARTGEVGVKPWFLHGIALAMLPWLHSRFAVLAGGFGALVLLRLSTTKNPAGKAVAFLVVPALSAMLWVGFFAALYGRPDPTAAYGPGEVGSFAFVPGGLGGLLFDGRFGALIYAPILGCAAAGLVGMLLDPRWRRLALELLFVILPYLLTVTHFAMWWGGWSAPARFAAPVLPLMALPAAICWTRIRTRTARTLALAAAAFTVSASAVLVWVDRGRLAFNSREAPALWLEWAGRAADLAAAAPTWSRDADVPLFRAAGIWLAALTAVWWALRRFESARTPAVRAAFATATAGALCAAAMLAMSMVWAVAHENGRRTAPAQLALLERLAGGGRMLALDLDRWRPVPPAAAARQVQIVMVRRTTMAAGRVAPPMFALPPLPAGHYRIRFGSPGERGLVMIGVAQDQFAVRTVELPAGAIELRTMVPLGGLFIRGDEDARRSVRRMELEPLRLFSPSERLTASYSRRAVRYDGWTVFFLDDGSFPEPQAFWVGGGREATVALQPEAAQRSARLHVRNGPVANDVRIDIESGPARTLALQPGQEAAVDVPVDRRRGGAVVTIESSAGFRPSEHDPASRDRRFLGVWVQVTE